MRRPSTVLVAALVSLAVVTTVCACAEPGAGSGPTSAGAGGPTTASSSATGSDSSTSGPVASATPTATTTSAACADVLMSRLTPAQRAGQLLMVGAQAGAAPTGLDASLAQANAGGVVLLGTWSGAATVKAATEHWQQTARSADGGIGLLVSADQEGGQVQHLKGSGFTPTPSALSQGRAPAEAGRTAGVVGREMAAAGVQVDLAPVADTVAASFAARNAPIGAYQREYGNDPATVAAAVTAVVGGLQGAGVSATLKHFPGLGRVTGNTDLTASGTVDATTTADDAYLEPFRAGIGAGADLVMVSSALYPRIDPDNRAMFSTPVVTGLLRQQLGFGGVVVTDDVGSAKAVADVPVGQRATRFVAAGGDIVLTALPSTLPAMSSALQAKAAAEPAFAAQVDAAARRVLALKVRRGLAAC